MDEPVIAQKFPYVLDLKPGEFWWCICGRSENQPFCDGSHKGSGFAPVKFSIEEHQQAALCGCKRSKKAPFCDGSHRELP